MSNVPADLKYTKEHEWVKFEGSVAVIGITDHAQHALGDIVFIQLPKPGAEAKFMKSVGVIESVKAASDIYSPLSGKVVAVNEALNNNPEAINKDCYGAGWIYKIEASNAAESGQLLDAAAYTELLSKA